MQRKHQGAAAYLIPMYALLDCDVRAYPKWAFTAIQFDGPGFPAAIVLGWILSVRYISFMPLPFHIWKLLKIFQAYERRLA